MEVNQGQTTKAQPYSFTYLNSTQSNQYKVQILLLITAIAAKVPVKIETEQSFVGESLITPVYFV